MSAPATVPVIPVLVLCLQGRAKADIPEVVGAILVADKDKSNLGVVLSWEDTDSGSRVVFIGMCTEGLVELLDQVGILAVERVALSIGGLLLYRIKVEGGVVCAVVVATVTQAVVLADKNAAAAAR